VALMWLWLQTHCWNQPNIDGDMATIADMDGDMADDMSADMDIDFSFMAHLLIGLV